MGMFSLGEIASMPVEDLVTTLMALIFSVVVTIHSFSRWPHLIASLLKAITYLVRTFARAITRMLLLDVPESSGYM